MMRGFSLIEVLIALVVLSIGLLGIAVLQVEGVKSSQTALLRTKAVLLAADMADRIRANALGDYNVGAGPAGAAPSTRCADDDGSVAANCSPADMAAYDIWLWKSLLASDGAMGLPGGAGAIARDASTTPPTHTISVSWTERGRDYQHVLSMQHTPRP